MRRVKLCSKLLGYRVRYIHDPNGSVHIPLYGSYGAATGKTARAKLARIVRGAPEVLVKVTGRQHGSSHLKAHLDYIGRKGIVDVESRDGEILTSKEDVAERAAEWSDTLRWRSRPTAPCHDEQCSGCLRFYPFSGDNP